MNNAADIAAFADAIVFVKAAYAADRFDARAMHIILNAARLCLKNGINSGHGLIRMALKADPLEVAFELSSHPSASTRILGRILANPSRYAHLSA